MNSEKLQLWILDTLAEDYYSFCELKDYILASGVSFRELENSLNYLFETGFIAVKYLLPGETFAARKYGSITNEDQKKAIDAFEDIARREKSSVSCHYLETTEAGLSYYHSSGYQQ
ncbi:MAG: hypothetical protein ABJN65_00940 [Parasphingorhabdus sp.]